jgi:hypothetical protein
MYRDVHEKTIYEYPDAASPCPREIPGFDFGTARVPEP